MNTAALARIFALVATSFGAVFILVNAGGLPAPLPLPTRLAAVLLVLLALWCGVLHRPEGERWPEPSRRGMQTYWAAVAAEVVAIPVGAQVLTRVLERPELTVVWVVLVVGLVGGTLTVLAGGAWPSLTAVLAGVLLLMTAATVTAGRSLEPAQSVNERRAPYIDAGQGPARG